MTLNLFSEKMHEWKDNGNSTQAKYYSSIYIYFVIFQTY